MLGVGTGPAFDAREVIGREQVEAEALARRHGCRMRVLQRDGEFLDRNSDFKSWRINVAVADGVVVAVLGVY